ncbi:MAG: hypothetical protein LBV04_02620, partial [Deferribacteraceae bacterium]|nr:hypothetical protein [Deferribacteraceae bacterium]
KADEFFANMQEYFNKPMPPAEKALAIGLVVGVIALVIFMIVRTIMFVQKHKKKRRRRWR